MAGRHEGLARPPQRATTPTRPARSDPAHGVPRAESDTHAPDSTVPRPERRAPPEAARRNGRERSDVAVLASGKARAARSRAQNRTREEQRHRFGVRTNARPEAARKIGRLGVGTGLYTSGKARAIRGRAQKRTREERCRRPRVRKDARRLKPRAEADARRAMSPLSCPNKRARQGPARRSGHARWSRPSRADADGAPSHESDEQSSYFRDTVLENTCPTVRNRRSETAIVANGKPQSLQMVNCKRCKW